MARSKIIEGLKSAVRHARGDASQATTYFVEVPSPKRKARATGKQKARRIRERDRK